MQASIRIQSEMTRASLLAKRLREQIAGMASTVLPSPQEPMAVDIQPNRRERGFDIYEGGAIAGDKIKFGGADSVAGCLNTCRNTPGCTAGEYRTSVSPREACSVYRHVSRLLGGAQDSTVFVKPAKAAGADLPPVQPKPGPAGESGRFDLADNVRVEGAELRSFRAPSPVACRDACEQESACVAFQHGRQSPVMGQCHLFSSLVSRHEDRAWRSGARVDATPVAASASTGGRCQPLGLLFRDPIALTEGMTLCNGIGQHEARVERIESRGVIFSVEGAGDFACSPGNVCQFNWPGAPSPGFRVVIAEGQGGAPATAQIVPQN